MIRKWPPIDGCAFLENESVARSTMYTGLIEHPFLEKNLKRAENDQHAHCFH